uniref:Uncharacterized protein n=1 Tax=Steinernema glaseri TaxID=37863 RepID=A0A1I8ADH9_9BILA
MDLHLHQLLNRRDNRGGGDCPTSSQLLVKQNITHVPENGTGSK